MKIGIFSGTFDPVHDGHVWLANKALELGLDRVVFAPETIPRRKTVVASLEQRVAMLETVTLENSNFEPLVISKDSSHTVDGVLDVLKERFSEDDEFTLILGADVFEHLERWENVQRLIEEVSFIIALRTEDDGELAVEVAGRLRIKPQMIVSEFPDLSSSKIREAVRKDEEPENIDKAVWEYIKAHKLYER